MNEAKYEWLLDDTASNTVRGVGICTSVRESLMMARRRAPTRMLKFRWIVVVVVVVRIELSYLNLRMHIRQIRQNQQQAEAPAESTSASASATLGCFILPVGLWSAYESADACLPVAAVSQFPPRRGRSR